MASDDLYMGPTLLAPGASGPSRGDRLARRLLTPLVAALVVLIAFFYVLYSPLQIDGDSMEPALHDADRVLRTRSAGEASPGDVVVIDTKTPSTSDDVVKRVIAVEGDTIEVRDDVAYVNGVPERTVALRVASGAVSVPPFVVPQGTVYVLGDNRAVSLDSRFIGPVRVSKIRGRVAFVFLPLSDFGPVH